MNTAEKIMTMTKKAREPYMVSIVDDDRPSEMPCATCALFLTGLEFTNSSAEANASTSCCHHVSRFALR
jgi:hypothetical protein